MDGDLGHSSAQHLSEGEAQYEESCWVSELGYLLIHS